MSLDRKRPYATIVGQAGHAYEQDGKCFDFDEKEVERAEVVNPPEEETSEARKIDLRKKENAHLRPTAKKA